MAEPVTVLLLVACTGLVLLPISYLAVSTLDYRPRTVIYARCVPSTTVVIPPSGEELLVVPASALARADVLPSSAE